MTPFLLVITSDTTFFSHQKQKQKRVNLLFPGKIYATPPVEGYFAATRYISKKRSTPYFLVKYMPPLHPHPWFQGKIHCTDYFVGSTDYAKKGNLHHCYGPFFLCYVPFHTIDKKKLLQLPSNALHIYFATKKFTIIFSAFESW